MDSWLSYVFVIMSLHESLIATVSSLASPIGSRSCDKYHISMCFILAPSPRLNVNLLAAHESDARDTDVFTPQTHNNDCSPRHAHDHHRIGVVLVFGT